MLRLPRREVTCLCATLHLLNQRREGGGGKGGMREMCASERHRSMRSAGREGMLMLAQAVMISYSARLCLKMPWCRLTCRCQRTAELVWVWVWVPHSSQMPHVPPSTRTLAGA